MRDGRKANRAVWLGGACALLILLAAPARAEIVDRIVARVGGDIITLSDLEALRRYQTLLGALPSDHRRLLDQLIEQRLILSEASTVAHTPMSAEAVTAELARLAERFGSRQAFEKRMAEVGLSQEELEHILARQGEIERFLDARFHAAVQLSEEELARYYREQFLPELHRRGVGQMPAFDEVEESIRELLTQQHINEMVSNWLVELKSRTKIEILAEP